MKIRKGNCPLYRRDGQTIFETTITTVAGISAGFLAVFPGLENFFMLMCLLIIFAFVTSSFLLQAFSLLNIQYETWSEAVQRLEN